MTNSILGAGNELARKLNRKMDKETTYNSELEDYTSRKSFRESTPRTQEFKLKLFEARLRRKYLQ